MSAEATKQTRAPLRCERCGSDLAIFEEHPDGSVIYCGCDCASRGNATNAPDAASLKTYCSRCGKPYQVFDDWGTGGVIFLPCACQTLPAAAPSAVRARLEREVRYCRHCHAALVVIGTRPDFSPIEAICPCQRPAPKKPKQPSAAIATRELDQDSKDRTFFVIVAAILVLGAALAGFWASR